MSLEVPYQAESCPCCGKDKPMGLFDALPCPPLPDPVARMLSTGMVFNYFSDNQVMVFGRLFIRIFATLPLDNPLSPLQIGSWVEISGLDVEKVMRRKAKKKLKLSGQLASDLPGFPGSIGSYCEVECAPESVDFRLVYCDDERIRSLVGPLSHEQMASLYRRCWGNWTEPKPSDESLRRAARGGWKRLMGREPIVKRFAPLPALSGIDAAELLIFPPLDTGGTARLATVGMAEAAPTPGELMCRVIDPPPEFVNSFAEFLYAPRMSMIDLTEGNLIGERQMIAGTNSMCGWLIEEEVGQCPLPGAEPLRLLAALPLHIAEMAFAERNGVKALREALADSAGSKTLTSLNREPIITP